MVAGVGDFVDVRGCGTAERRARLPSGSSISACRSGAWMQMRSAAAKETPATGVLQILAASSARSSIAGSGAASRI